MGIVWHCSSLFGFVGYCLALLGIAWDYLALSGIAKSIVRYCHGLAQIDIFVNFLFIVSCSITKNSVFFRSH